MPFAVVSVVNVVTWTFVGLLAAGLLCVAYGVFVEHRWYRRADYRLPILPGGARPLTLLHVSDLHFLRRDDAKARFLASLPQADVTIATGDLVGEPEAVETAVDALSGVRGRIASYFVLGSNDLFAPRRLNPAAYFFPQRRRPTGRPGRARDLVRLLEADGWTHLDNVKTTLSNDGVRFEVVGLGDAHIYRHDLRVAPRSDPAAFGLAIAHSPDPAPELAALGYDLIVTGHTHGGQVRIPFRPRWIPLKLVDTSRIYEDGWLEEESAAGNRLYVNRGLGFSGIPVRIGCPPEVTLFTLLRPPALRS